MEQRRRWASSGAMPPALASRFTLAEQAVLSVVAAEVAGAPLRLRAQSIRSEHHRNKLAHCGARGG